MEEFSFCKNKFISVIILKQTVPVGNLASTQKYKEEIKVTHNLTTQRSNVDPHEAV